MKNLKIDGFVFQIVNEAEAIERINQNKEVLIPYNTIIAIGDFVVVSEEDLL